MPADLNVTAERAALALFDAALDIAPDARSRWLDAQCGGNDALRSRVEALLKTDDEASVPFTGLLDGGPGLPGDALLPPPQVGPYRLVALIGSGGMGAVYRAQRNDGLFEQTVAIKFVRTLGARIDTAALVDAERRLLARMQHPGIARILDGGTTADGLHYLVMEFVQGVPIDEHVRVHALPVQARLALLLEVCAALADAHRHLVLHCDVKPANILVGEDGHAKLIDFGIARLLDVADATLPHGFTRAYASPQRLAGAPPTVADDVYALGVLLAELLAGERPQDADAPMPGLDAELAAVARKALDADPAARHSSVDAFADDLMRWREKRPVSALPPHWRYRLRKLVQRRPWRVAAGGAALLGLVGALTVITLLYTRAEAARHQAEQRFGEVRALASYLLFDLDGQLETLPGTTAMRRGLVERSQRYLDTLAGTAGGNAELAREAAVGLGRLAEVQGGWAMPHVGEREAARTNFERALAMLQAQLARQPADWRLLRDLGRVQHRLADFHGGVDNDAHRQAAQARDAEAHLRRALALAGPAGARPAEMGELHALLNGARLSQAFAMDWTGQSAEALALGHDEEERLLALPEPLRHEMDFELRLGRTATAVADSLFYLDRFAEALDGYRRAQLHYGLALQAAPNQRRLLDAISVSLWGSALSLREIGRHAEALQDLERAQDAVDRVLALDPQNRNAERMKLVLENDRASVLGRLGRFDEAIALSTANLNARASRAAAAPDLSEPARDALVTMHDLADLHWRRGDIPAGCTAAQRAIAGWAAYAKRWSLTELDRKENAAREAEAARRCTR